MLHQIKVLNCTSLNQKKYKDFSTVRIPDKQSSVFHFSLHLLYENRKLGLGASSLTWCWGWISWWCTVFTPRSRWMSLWHVYRSILTEHLSTLFWNRWTTSLRQFLARSLKWTSSVHTNRSTCLHRSSLLSIENSSWLSGSKYIFRKLIWITSCFFLTRAFQLTLTLSVILSYFMQL